MNWSQTITAYITAVAHLELPLTSEIRITKHVPLGSATFAMKTFPTMVIHHCFFERPEGRETTTSSTERASGN
jgi:hypothetical protein